MTASAAIAAMAIAPISGPTASTTALAAADIAMPSPSPSAGPIAIAAASVGATAGSTDQATSSTDSRACAPLGSSTRLDTFVCFDADYQAPIPQGTLTHVPYAWLVLVGRPPQAFPVVVATQDPRHLALLNRAHPSDHLRIEGVVLDGQEYDAPNTLLVEATAVT